LKILVKLSFEKLKLRIKAKLIYLNFNQKYNKMDNPNDKPVIYVGGLDDQVDEKVLHSAFIPFGEIKTIEMPLDHNTGIIQLKKISRKII